jgi:uncharacterized protein
VEHGKSEQTLAIGIWVKALPWRAASGCTVEWLPESTDCWEGYMDVQFEWDRGKAALNLRKHGVSFGEGSRAFRDPLAFIFDDEAHSGEERREIIIGHGTSDPLLLVCFIERAENVVRIISARLATKSEPCLSG